MPNLSPVPAASSLPGPSTGPGASSLIVVGIGASAGGLEALSTLVANLPVDSNIAYVVAQHMSPQHRSMMVDLLARSSTVQVVEAADGMLLEPDILYVTPPNRNLEIRGGRITLSDTFPGGPKPSVDLLMKSLSDGHGELAVGVVLSGSGSDGAQGVRAIKAAGGITIAQEPASAKYDSMPEAAIRTGSIDIVLPPERIGPELIKLVRAPRGADARRLDEASNSYATIIDMIRHRTNTDFEDYKPATIGRRIDRRLAALRIDSLEDYVDYLSSHPEEIDKLRADILISVTSFFRDHASFEALDRAIGESLARKSPGDAFRIWVPGCATGEEVYSIAILIAERLRGDSMLRRVQMFAVDIDDAALSFARRAVYPASAIATLDEALINRYFVRTGDNHFQVAKDLRDWVVFSRQDITRDPPFSRLDLVSCRNLLIYFNPKLQTRVLEAFHYALNPNGTLFLGKSETIGSNDSLFSIIDRTHKLYRRHPGQRIPLGFLGGAQRGFVPGGRVGIEQKPEQPPIVSLMQRAFAEAYAPPPSVAVDEGMRILHVHGDVTPFLRLNPGRAEQDILTMAAPELRTTLRAVLHRAMRAGEDGVFLDARMAEGSGIRHLRISVRPMNARGSVPWLHLVTFETLPAAAVMVARDDGAEDGEAGLSDDTRIAELEHELNATREHLQTVIEELETANEELQATNEELQSSNEELQATNEELETTNEELQSTNEELETVNDELRAKSAELFQKTADLENIEESLEFPLLLVDTDLRIRLFNRAARALFGLKEEDVGMSVIQLPMRIDLPDLRRIFGAVLERAEIHRSEVRDASERVFQQLIVPYRDSQRGVNGAIMTLVDITERAQMQRILGQVNTQFSEAQRISHVGSWRYLMANDEVVWSDEVFRICGLVPSAAVLDRAAFVEGFHPDDRVAVRRAFDTAASGGTNFSFKHRVVRPTGELRHVWVEGLCEHDGKGAPLALFGVLRDITESVQAAKLLTESHSRMATVLDTIVDGIIVVNTKGIILMANRAVHRMFGYDDTAESLVGKNINILMPDAEHRRHDEYMQTYLKTGQRKIIGISRDVVGQRRDGQSFPLELSVGEIFDEVMTGDPQERRAFIGTLRDISARKLYEEALLTAKRTAEAANEAKSSFLAQMSHELRTPLNAIIGFSEIIKDSILGPVQPVKYQQYSRDIFQSGQHLLRIINDILDLSRIEAGKVTIENDVVDLSEVTATSVKLIETTVRDKQITLVVDLPSDLPRLRADDRAVRQIIINLLSNATKFTASGGTITVRAMVEERGLVTEIEDTGIGMSPDEVDWALLPFGRTYSEKAKSHEGTGLGLVITKSLVELHQGTLVIASQPGEGTRVTVCFPPSRVIGSSFAANQRRRV